MSRSIERIFIYVALPALATGCYQNQTDPPEVCNYRDDNWDGTVDEPFTDGDGRYSTIENCGGCGVDCRLLFPTAEATACVAVSTAQGGGKTALPYRFGCEIVSCPSGTHLVGESFCAPDREVVCQPCLRDLDCAMVDPMSKCAALDNDDRRCLSACTDGMCAAGFSCVEMSSEDDPRCVPTSGVCACTAEHAGEVFGCRLSSPEGDGRVCYGSRLCDGTQLSACEPLFEERCDNEDNDCDGVTDEDFLVDGLYLHEDHCGACNRPCKANAANTEAVCRLVGETPTCIRTCLDGYVDVDNIALNGCECFKTGSVWPPSAFGGDMDCDGAPDAADGFIFVSKTGDDSNPGSLDAPVATITRGIALADARGATVVVSQGRYEEAVSLVGGVSVYGGYRADFAERNTDLFETVIQGEPERDGSPVLSAVGIAVATEISGFTVVGADATHPGGSTTAVLFSQSGPLLEMRHVKVILGDAADGRSGISSHQVLSEMGYPPEALDGVPGAEGAAGYDTGVVACSSVTPGGEGGTRSCPLSDLNVSGGNGGGAACPDTQCQQSLPCPNAGCADYMVNGICDMAAVLEGAVPSPAAQSGFGGPGAGEAGELTYDAPTTRAGSTFCDDGPSLRREGGAGGSGTEGNPGIGGAGCTDPGGIFDVTDGLLINRNGEDGASGTDGMGGGGGTQGNGYDVLPWAGLGAGYTDRVGGAGGGGGSGGCGAPGAEKGEGGGSAVGIAVILPASGTGPLIEQTRVLPGRAGDGGDGGTGAAGGMPGTGGNGGDGNYWCARRGGRGGDGGRGGSGGGGGGGCGGSLVGFLTYSEPDGRIDPAYQEMLMEQNSVDPFPAAGKGGKGGYSPGASGTSGAPGTAEAFWFR